MPPLNEYDSKFLQYQELKTASLLPLANRVKNIDSGQVWTYLQGGPKTGPQTHDRNSVKY